MRILLGVDSSSDPLAVSDYVAARFDGDLVEVDVLTVVEEESAPARGPAIASAVAERLRGAHSFARVRVRRRGGTAADEIVAAADAWRSALVLLGAPRRRGVLTAFGLGSVARGVSTRARCPVELFRTDARGGDGGNRAIAVLDVERLDEFPFEELKLQLASWRAGGSLRIVGVRQDALDRFGDEANPAAVLRGLALGEDDRAWTEARLARVCAALREAFGSGIAVDYRVVDGHTREIALGSAEQLRASLLALDSPATEGAWRGLFSRLSPAALTMAAPCSVLLLRADLSSVACEERYSTGPVRRFS